MRRLFTTEEARAHGVTSATLRWGVRAGRWRRVLRGAYAQGPEDPSDLDIARARALVCTDAVARGHLAGVLHKLDAVVLRECLVRRRPLARDRVTFIERVPCADGLQTLVDLAANLDDLEWEQALESALRK